MDEREQETEVRENLFEDDGHIPNNPMLPLLVYPQALDSSEQNSSRCKELLAENGWGGAWVNGVFSYHHLPLECPRGALCGKRFCKHRVRRTRG